MLTLARRVILLLLFCILAVVAVSCIFKDQWLLYLPQGLALKSLNSVHIVYLWLLYAFRYKQQLCNLETRRICIRGTRFKHRNSARHDCTQSHKTDGINRLIFCIYMMQLCTTILILTCNILTILLCTANVLLHLYTKRRLFKIDVDTTPWRWCNRNGDCLK